MYERNGDTDESISVGRAVRRSFDDGNDWSRRSGVERQDMEDVAD